MSFVIGYSDYFRFKTLHVNQLYKAYIKVLSGQWHMLVSISAELQETPLGAN